METCREINRRECGQCAVGAGEIGKCPWAWPVLWKVGEKEWKEREWRF